MAACVTSRWCRHSKSRAATATASCAPAKWPSVRHAGRRAASPSPSSRYTSLKLARQTKQPGPAMPLLRPQAAAPLAAAAAVAAAGAAVVGAAVVDRGWTRQPHLISQSPGAQVVWQHCFGSFKQLGMAWGPSVHWFFSAVTFLYVCVFSYQTLPPFLEPTSCQNKISRRCGLTQQQ